MSIEINQLFCFLILNGKIGAQCAYDDVNGPVPFFLKRFS